MTVWLASWLFLACTPKPWVEIRVIHMGKQSGAFFYHVEEEAGGVCPQKAPRSAWCRHSNPDRRAPLQIITTLAELVAAVLAGYLSWIQIRAYRRNRRR